MITDQNPKEYYDKIVDAPDKQKPFRLLLFILFLALGGWGTTFVSMKSEQKELRQEIKDLQTTSVNDNKACQIAIREAEERKDSIWGAKVDKIKEDADKELKIKARKWDSTMEDLTRQVLNVKKREAVKLREKNKSNNE